MAIESGPMHVGTFTLVAAGTPQALTSRDIRCNEVFLLPKAGDVVYLVDSVDNAEKITIPTAGLVVPIGSPAAIKLDGAQNADICYWMTT